MEDWIISLVITRVIEFWNGAYFLEWIRGTIYLSMHMYKWHSWSIKILIWIIVSFLTIIIMPCVLNTYTFANLWLEICLCIRHYRYCCLWIYLSFKKKKMQVIDHVHLLDICLLNCLHNLDNLLIIFFYILLVIT